MGREIERKYLVHVAQLPRDAMGVGRKFEQGYLSRAPSVRVRRADAGTENAQAWLTVKGPGMRSRAEFEYEIPADDADELLALCPTKLTKIRYRVKVGRHVWEIDEFTGAHAGLWLAEIELDDENEAFDAPAWLDREVSGEARYTNSALAAAGRAP